MNLGGSKDPSVLSTSPVHGPGCQSGGRDLGVFTRVPALGFPGGRSPSQWHESILTQHCQKGHFGAEGEKIAVT